MAPRAFSLLAAKRAFGEDPVSIHWSEFRAGWLLASRSRTALISKDRLRELPRGAFPVVMRDEKQRGTTIFEVSAPDKTTLPMTYPVHFGKDGVSVFITVPHEKLLTALEAACSEKLEVVLCWDGDYQDFALQPLVSLIICRALMT